MYRIKWTLLLIVLAMNVNAQAAHYKHPSAKDSVILSDGVVVFQRNIKSLQGNKWQLWFRKGEEVTLIDEVEHKRHRMKGFFAIGIHKGRHCPTCQMLLRIKVIFTYCSLKTLERCCKSMTSKRLCVSRRCI